MSGLSPRRPRVILALSLVATLFSLPVCAGFASNEVYLASIGRGGGASGAQFYSTLWVTNLSSSATVHFTFFFLKDGQSNLTGDPSFNDTLAPGQTKLYEDVTETKLNLPGLFGAARITADGEVFASERVYNLAHSTDNLGTSEGLFFAAVPKSFAIGLGDTASIQGVNQGSPTENMRTNFDLVETTGNTCKVHVTLLDSNGTSQGATDVSMNPYGHVKLNAQALLHSVDTINGRIVATVTSGSGQVILAGEQLANTSQDSSGFEMSFKDSLVAGGCGVCVTSVNGLSGAVTIAAGTNVTVGKSGQTITINAATGGSGGGLSAVAHDSTLQGDGTGGMPLGVKLPASWSAGAAGSSVLSVTNTLGGTALAILGTGTDSVGVAGVGTGTGTGVVGLAAGNIYGGESFSFTGVAGLGTPGVFGLASGSGGGYVAGVVGVNSGNRGELGTSSAGVEGDGSGGSNGVLGISGGGNSAGVEGQFSSGGNVGALGGFTYGVYYQGGLAGTGTKNFIEPHPTDPTREIRYVSLEGRESGTYFRGKARIVNGFATIDVPGDFRMVTSEEGLTVVATPIGGPAMIWVARQGLDRIVLQSSADVEFSYMVNGVRKAFSDWEPVSPNLDFVPRSADGRRLVAGLPAENLQRLKSNGTLNSDGTVNLETAHRLGWDQRPGWNEQTKIDKESK